MKFLCLGYYDERKFEALPKDAAHLGERVGWGVEVRPIDYFDEPGVREKQQ